MYLPSVYLALPHMTKSPPLCLHIGSDLILGQILIWEVQGNGQGQRD